MSVYCVLVGFTWRVLQWNLFCFTRDHPCPWGSRGVLRLRCFYLSGVRGTCFFNLSVVVMGSKWSSSLESTRPPNESSRFIFVGTRRVFASSKNTCYLQCRQPCFSHRNHPGHLAPGRLMVEAIPEPFAVCCSHCPGGNFSGFSLDGFWRDGIVFVAKHIREKSR